MTYRSMLSRPALGLGRDLDRIFDDVISPTAAQGWTPAVDVRETAEALLVEADLPGLAPSEVEVQAMQQVLTISGTRTRAEAVPTSGRAPIRERAFGTFRRRFQLPQGVDTSRIEASFANGVLTVRIPKPAAAQPRTITVQSAPTPA